jgi:hypothetical protein
MDDILHTVSASHNVSSPNRLLSGGKRAALSDKLLGIEQRFLRPGSATLTDSRGEALLVDKKRILPAERPDCVKAGA